MIVHAVYFSIRDGVDPRDVQALLGALQEFCHGLNGAISFEFGPNRDYENKSAGFSDGFLVRFKDRAALAHYAQHPRHKELGAQLTAVCKGGAEGIMVFDLEVAAP